MVFGFWINISTFALQSISCQEHILYTTPCFIFSSFITNKPHKRLKNLWWLMAHLFRRTLILILSQNCIYAAFTAVVAWFVIHKGTMLLSSVMYEIINYNIITFSTKNFFPIFFAKTSLCWWNLKFLKVHEFFLPSRLAC